MDLLAMIIFLFVIGVIMGLSGLVLIIIGLVKKKGITIWIGVSFILVAFLGLVWLLKELENVRWKVGG